MTFTDITTLSIAQWDYTPPSILLVNDGVHFGRFFKNFRRLTFSLCSGYKGLAYVPDGKHSRGLHIIPVLLCEGVHTKSTAGKGGWRMGER